MRAVAEKGGKGGQVHITKVTGNSVAALKRVIAWQLAETMTARKVTKPALAERMHTSRRSLDQNDPSMTLATLASAARALGQRVGVRLVPDESAMAI